MLSLVPLKSEALNCNLAGKEFGFLHTLLETQLEIRINMILKVFISIKYFWWNFASLIEEGRVLNFGLQ